jgi:hypothetical protein
VFDSLSVFFKTSDCFSVVSFALQWLDGCGCR